MINRLMLAVAALAASVTFASSLDQPAATTARDLLRFEDLSALPIGDPVLLNDFPLGAAGRFTLDLERFSVLTPDSIIVEVVGLDERPIQNAEPVLLRGTIIGEHEASTVFISVGPFGVHGFISRNTTRETYHISTGPYTGPLAPDAVVHVTSSLEVELPLVAECLLDPNNPAFRPDLGLAPASPQSRTARGTGAGCTVAPIGIDTDFEFTSFLFGGNTTASAQYATALLAAASIIYERDVNVSMTIPFLRVWATNTDPFADGDIGRFLDDLRNHWRTFMGHIPRTVAHGLSARNLGGGVAYVDVLCNNDWGYGVSANLGGFFPFPMTDHSHQNWDIFVFAHELGHNFGTLHTHDGYDPVIDGCGLGDCSQAWGGTIMSYCHGCPGGMSNISLALHPRVQDVIEPRVASAPCVLSSSESINTADDSALTIVGSPTTIDVLANDIALSCAPVSLSGVQSPTQAGGTAAIVQGTNGRNVIQYTPSLGFTGVDTFTYTVNSGASANVSVEVIALRQPDQPSVVEPGVAVDYYLFLSPPSVLPDFDTLSPYLSDVLTAIDIPSTNGAFATSNLANNVGAVFQGYITVSLPGLYTFATESDDGSKLWIGDRLVVDNDGLHGMQTRTGIIGLLPGKHAVRVEFFEAGGGAGLRVSSAFFNFPLAIVPANAWSHSPDCIADWNDDGLTDFFDLIAFLGAFSSQSLSTDLNDDGAFDFFDITIFLAEFSQGCP